MVRWGRALQVEGTVDTNDWGRSVSRVLAGAESDKVRSGWGLTLESWAFVLGEMRSLQRALRRVEARHDLAGV